MRGVVCFHCLQPSESRLVNISIFTHEGLNVNDATGGFALVDMAQVVSALGKLDGSAGKIGATLNFADIGTIVNCGACVD